MQASQGAIIPYELNHFRIEPHFQLRGFDFIAEPTKIIETQYPEIIFYLVNNV